MSEPNIKPDLEKKDPEPEKKEELAEGTLISHLIELRQRLVKATLAVVVVFLGLLPFSDDIFEMVSKPLRDVLPEGGQLVAYGIATPFVTPFKATFFAAVFLAMPIVLYQIWRFVAPGLYRKEKRFAIPLLASSIILFYIGVAFAYFLVFGLIFKFFIGVTPESVANMPDINAYLSFVLALCFAFGVAFEVPIATFMLIWSGLVSIKTLSAWRPYIFLGAFVIGMFLTPPDVFSQTLLALPMYALYEGGLLMARIMLPEKANPVEAADEAK